MTTRYRVEYALKTHRRDQFIEWIKGLLAVPFVLNSQPAAAYSKDEDSDLAFMASSAHQRYADIFRDVELLVSDHIKHQEHGMPRSKLSMLVPTISSFFTPLSLVLAFKHQDARRAISSRRFVPPSFNDIRLILNSSQAIPLMRPPNKSNGLQLLTFDGDLTLYEDGGSLNATSSVIPYLMHFLSRGVKIGIVTAAGYHDASKYYTRLAGLLDAVRSSNVLTTEQKHGLIVMGGESNFLFVFDETSEHCLRYIHRRDWILNEMRHWSEPAIQSLLDAAESAFHDCIKTLHLSASVLRKERAVGIYHDSSAFTSATSTPGPGPHQLIHHHQPTRLTREQLEETVLVVQQILEAYSSNLLKPVPNGPSSSSSLSSSQPSQQQQQQQQQPPPPIPWTAFNGGADVFVDIGDKSLGVQACQKWFGGIKPACTLHVGDQFLSGGGNDFKARNACCTAWIASPEETVALLAEMVEFGQEGSS